jgi:hypothetical protein
MRCPCAARSLVVIFVMGFLSSPLRAAESNECYAQAGLENANIDVYVYVYDPHDQSIETAHGSGWQFAQATATATPTVTGDYWCFAQAYVDGVSAGEGWDEAGYWTPPVPTGETTYSGGWDTSLPTVHKWNSQLTGGTFSGNNRRIYEQANGGGPDTCWWSGSAFAPQTSIPTGVLGNWPIGSQGTWGPDYVGWTPTYVVYYRNQFRAPCETALGQRMYITWPNGGSAEDREYQTGTLRMGVTYTTVWSQRNGQTANKSY